MRLPVLITHFMEHRQRDSHIQFTEFLSMHYWGKDIDDNDDDRDRQLPFRTIDTHLIHTSFVPYSKPIILSRRDDDAFLNVHYPLMDDHHLPNPALSSLFRPPRA
ncbi:MAG: hypothetical protein J0H74_34180 [Chitinophagaceae bacterium]|nr:hypothetical protein [Chitinophagaceae bacterium]